MGVVHRFAFSFNGGCVRAPLSAFIFLEKSNMSDHDTKDLLALMDENETKATTALKLVNRPAADMFRSKHILTLSELRRSLAGVPDQTPSESWCGREIFCFFSRPLKFCLQATGPRPSARGSSRA
jgi:hypothetical protein